ncbi:hypothetical protein ACFL5O_01410 [Myxococcota bacterium]
MKRNACAKANDPVAEQAARELLAAGGSAMGAVLCGYFAAGGAYAGVLLGPMTVLVGGLGSGVRAFDGRVRQPGRGAKRPRGFAVEDTIPDAARVGVPTGVAAALVAHAYDTGKNLGSVLRAGLEHARQAGASVRVGLIQQILSVGVGALASPGFVRAMLRVAGPSEGGLLTPSDFVPMPEVDYPAVERLGLGGLVSEAPWAGDFGESELPRGRGEGFAICASDGRGGLAVLCYRRVSDGLVLNELELEAPLLAVPVRRGQTRVSPGRPLPAPAPAVLLRDPGSAFSWALAAPTALRLSDGVQGCLRAPAGDHTPRAT